MFQIFRYANIKGSHYPNYERKANSNMHKRLTSTPPPPVSIKCNFVKKMNTGIKIATGGKIG